MEPASTDDQVFWFDAWCQSYCLTVAVAVILLIDTRFDVQTTIYR